ncbi:MAG TPA: ribonuclease HII [Vicinamibacteria bacterium]|nr:ribonuclease HII [Vicinamibacteria bacterium]
MEASQRGRRPLTYQGRELRCSFHFEEEARALGCAAVAGADEVGRGALCGPVLACAVILPLDFDPTGIDDSKRLTPRQREAQADRIRRQARAVSVGAAEVAEIDRLNILQATYLALSRAVRGLAVAPDFLLVDALRIPGLEVPQRGIVKGDAQSVSIAAASIVAKVSRDALMGEWDRRFPGYGLARNMGYGSAGHRDAIRTLGPSAIHRRSFRGTSERWLF